MPDENQNAVAPTPPSRFHHFVTTYSTFLSSFVIGGAGGTVPPTMRFYSRQRPRSAAMIVTAVSSQELTLAEMSTTVTPAHL